MAALLWLFPLCFAGGVLVHGQGTPDTTGTELYHLHTLLFNSPVDLHGYALCVPFGYAGFISIDCGLSEQRSYVDGTSKLPYSSDDGFIDDGSNYNVSAEYTDLAYSRIYPQVLNLRSFPGPPGRRGCYTLSSFVAGTSKYLIRATFMYGNYDGLNKPPVFDLYLGVNFWKTVNISKPDVMDVGEVIAYIPADSVQVCLVNTGSGTPFISSLELRPLEDTLYPLANSTQGLSLIGRYNFGGDYLIR
jgi:hypothetical protein